MLETWDFRVIIEPELAKPDDDPESNRLRAQRIQSGLPEGISVMPRSDGSIEVRGAMTRELARALIERCVGRMIPYGSRPVVFGWSTGRDPG